MSGCFQESDEEMQVCNWYTMEPEAAYLSVIAIPPDGALAVDLTITIHRQVVDAEEGQEVGRFSCPNVVWCHNVAIQLQITSSAGTLKRNLVQQERPSCRDDHDRRALVAANRLPRRQERLFDSEEDGGESEMQEATRLQQKQAIQFNQWCSCCYLCIISLAIPMRMEVEDVVDLILA